MKKLNFSEKGFSLIEILVAGTVITISFVGISTFLLFSRDASEKTKESTKAVALAEEAIEAVRKLRDDNWNNISGQSGEKCPVISGNSWDLNNAPCPEVDGYRTSVTFSAVCRDGNSNIAACPSAETDSKTKKIDAKVTWDGGNEKVELTTYITNFKE